MLHMKRSALAAEETRGGSGGRSLSLDAVYDPNYLAISRGSSPYGSGRLSLIYSGSLSLSDVGLLDSGKEDELEVGNQDEVGVWEEQKLDRTSTAKCTEVG